MISFINYSFSQVIETEETLKEHIKEQKKDTLEGWRTGGMVSLNFAQTSLTNWSSGGQNSISGNGIINLYAKYKKGGKAWDNSLEIGYGILRQEKENLMKTDDKIDLFSKYGVEIFKDFYFASLFNFRTQMAPGYNYPNDSIVISDFFAPAYSMIAIGLDYKPSKSLNIFASPLSGKFTFVQNQELANAGAYGVNPAEYDNLGILIKKGRKNRSEIGGYVRLLYKKDISENISFQNKLDLFSNYLNNPENIDVNWEIIILMKISKYITANISTHLVYDDDIMIEIDKNGDGITDNKGPRTQFKEIFAIGFSYKFDRLPKQ
jgi:hypothetical protein